MSDIYNGDEVIIRGTITRSSGGNNSKTFDVRDHINPETAEVASQASQTVIQSVVSQAQTMGMSGVIAVSSGVYFQADAVADNWVEAVEVAQPLVNELVETGTITPPIGSKYEGVAIPTPTSFLGVKVGEERKRQQAYDALPPEQKALQDEFKKSIRAPNGQAGERDASSI